MGRSVLFITVDQWRGDCLSALGHPLLETPALDALAADGVLFANHWANTAPCGPSRACLYTGTYLHHHRSLLNGTPLDARFTNVALLARAAGYAPALFGYTDTTPDPRTLPPGDPALRSYEGVLPGFDPVLTDRWEEGSPEWGRWLASHGIDVPANPHDLYHPVEGWPGADSHGPTWAPARFPAELSQSAWLVTHLQRWLEEQGDRPFFVHASFIRPHPPFRNPPGYHDRYDEAAVPAFTAAPSVEEEGAVHPFNPLVLGIPGLAAPADPRDRRQLRATYHGAQREVDDQLGVLFAWMADQGLWDDTLVVVTSDHGEMGGDHWLTEKLGYWDESYHVPLIVRDPDAAADDGRGAVVRAFTESVDVLPTLCRWMGVEVPAQADGRALTPFLEGEGAPADWRDTAHFEWAFAHPQHRWAEQFFGVPSSHCQLAVARGAREKYVQFATDDSVLGPLLFDLEEDPAQLHNLAGRRDAAERAGAAARALAAWRMRTDERELARSIVDPGRGLVTATEW